MFDTAMARKMMVDGQIRPINITNLDLIGTMLAVPRELFVPKRNVGQAYLDCEVAIGEGRALLRPTAVAKLIQAAEISAGDRVLDVGCGTGYTAAVVVKLAGSVVALEEDPALAQQAKEALAAAGAASVVVASGPLAAGWPAGAPYDVILLDGATEVVPDSLASQLKPNGRIAAVVGGRPLGKGTVYRLVEGRLVGRPFFDAAAPLLPGFAAPAAFVF